MTFANSPLQDLLPMELPELTLSQADSRARTLAQAAISEVWTAPGAGSGRRAFGLLASYDLNSCSWRTLQTSWSEKGVLGLAEFSETWPRSGTMLSGTVYQLPTLAYPSQGIGSGLLPTPNASDGYAWTRTSKTSVRRSIWKALVRGGQIRFNYFPQWANFTPNQAAILAEMTMGFPPGWTE